MQAKGTAKIPLSTYRLQFCGDFKFSDAVKIISCLNSMSQVLLKITATGVPDFYQGTELWDFSLVDPDNRKPVDYSRRTAQLEDIKKVEEEMGILNLASQLTKHKKDGKIKMYLIYRALNFRRANRLLFEEGSYIPLEIVGSNAENICAFVRYYNGDMVIVIAPRMVTRIIDKGWQLHFKRKIWGNSHVLLPSKESINGFNDRLFQNVFTGKTIECKGHGDMLYLPLHELFENFPVGMLKNVAS